MSGSSAPAPVFSLADFILHIWRARVFLVIGAALGAVIALALVFLLRPQYEIRMIIAPPRQGAESLDFLAGDLPPVLSPLAGQAASRDGEYTRFQQSLRGPAAAAVLIKMDGMTGALNEKSLFRGGGGRFSDAIGVADHLEHAVRIDPLGATESLRLSYRHPDAEAGRKMLRNLVRIADQLIRLDVRRDVEARIEWLKRELKSTLNPEHKQALTRLLMAEERRRMLLSIETPYALSIIEDATASPQPVVPDAMILFPVLVFFGMLGGVLVFYLRSELSGRAWLQYD